MTTISHSIFVLTLVDLQLLAIKNSRIDELLDEISQMQLCELPTYESWTTETFLANTTVGIQLIILPYWLMDTDLQMRLLSFILFMKTCQNITWVKDLVCLNHMASIYKSTHCFIIELRHIDISEISFLQWTWCESTLSRTISFCKIIR